MLKSSKHLDLKMTKLSQWGQQVSVVGSDGVYVNLGQFILSVHFLYFLLPIVSQTGLENTDSLKL